MKNIFYFVFIAIIVQCSFAADSCEGRCGDYDGTTGCQCNDGCSDYDDCCSDYTTICLSCEDRCGEDYLAQKPCQCNSECPDHGNCCEDYDTLCQGSSGSTETDSDVIALSEEIYQLDQSLLVGDLIVLDTEVSTPLFRSVDPAAFEGPTISTFIPLMDNYDPYSDVAETENAQEIAETDAFLDAVMATDVMIRTEEFMTEHNMISKPLREVIEDIFFTQYTRADPILGSSGFEHSFMGEIDDAEVKGFHNWISFYFDEAEGDLDYTEDQGEQIIGNDLSLLQMSFDWLSYTKPISSMLIGSTPELELALYTVCFYHVPNQLCDVSMNGVAYRIQTYVQQCSVGECVGSAYPDLI